MGKRGPAPILPTQEELEQIRICSACGLTQEEIGKVIGKSVDWLKKHDEAARAIEEGRAVVKAKIGGSIIREAMKGNMTAAIFYAKTQMGWKERSVMEHEHYDLTNLSDQELDALEQLRSKIALAGGDPSGAPKTIN